MVVTNQKKVSSVIEVNQNLIKNWCFKAIVMVNLRRKCLVIINQRVRFEVSSGHFAGMKKKEVVSTIICIGYCCCYLDFQIKKE